MNEALSKFEFWLNKNFTEAFHDLNKPISEEKIGLLEKTIPIKPPKNLINFIKKHNGQKGDSGWIIDDSELLLSEMNY